MMTSWEKKRKLASLRLSLALATISLLGLFYVISENSLAASSASSQAKAVRNGGSESCTTVINRDVTIPTAWALIYLIRS